MKKKSLNYVLLAIVGLILTIAATVYVVTTINNRDSNVESKQDELRPKQEQVVPASDSVVIKGTYTSDTAKVIATKYVEDGSITWVKGYVVVRSFVPTGGQPLAAGQVLYNSKFEAIKPEDVESVKQVDWK